MQVSERVHMLDCLEKRQKGVDYLFLGKLLFKMQPCSLRDLRIQSRLLFLIEEALIEGKPCEDIGMVDSYIRGASC